MFAESRMWDRVGEIVSQAEGPPARRYRPSLLCCPAKRSSTPAARMHEAITALQSALGSKKPGDRGVSSGDL